MFVVTLCVWVTEERVLLWDDMSITHQILRKALVCGSISRKQLYETYGAQGALTYSVLFPRNNHGYQQRTIHGFKG